MQGNSEAAFIGSMPLDNDNRIEETRDKWLIWFELDSQCKSMETLQLWGEHAETNKGSRQTVTKQAASQLKMTVYHDDVQAVLNGERHWQSTDGTEFGDQNQTRRQTPESRRDEQTNKTTRQANRVAKKSL